MDPKALENVGQRCSSVQPQIRRVAHHHLKVQGTAGHCFITLTGQRNLAMRGSSKQDSTEPQLEPADEANCELQHQRRQKFAPFPNPAKANRFNAVQWPWCANTPLFQRKQGWLGGRSCFGIISSITSCVAWQLSQIVLSQRDFRLNGITTHADRWLTLVPFFLRDPGSKIFCSNSIALQNTLPPLRISIAQSLTYKSSYSHLLPCRKICVA